MKRTYVIIGMLLVSLVACQPKAEKQADADATEKTLQLVNVNEFTTKPTELFDKGWFLLTAGKDGSYNPMTISWGTIGTLWQQPVVSIFVRPSRHTYGFVENSRYFTLCAFDEDKREMLQFMGTKSGRDMDKVKEAGLTPVITEFGSQYYAEANLVIECEKIYYNDLIAANISDTTAVKSYPNGENVHRMYVGKIVNIWQKK